MDSLKFGPLINQGFCIDPHKLVIGKGSFQPSPESALQILPMIEQRIRKANKPTVERAKDDLERVICREFEKMGIDWQQTSLTQFSHSIAEQYADILMQKRVTEIVDALTGTSVK